MLKPKILVTGGHLSPVLAILPSLKKQKYELVVVGRFSAFNNLSQPGLEYQLLSSSKKLKFYTLSSGRFTQGEWYRIPLELWGLLVGIFRAWSILNKEKPNLILSFGGYLSLPICLVGKMLGIEIRLHEQTINPGKANIFLSRLATHVFATFPESRRYFPKNKTTVLGITLRSDYQTRNKPTDFIRTDKPLLLVMGGSSGSHSINILIEQLLPKLIDKFQIVHQTGDNKFFDYERLSQSKQTNYLPLRYLLPETIGYFYHQANLIISRSGANTFFELISMAKPAILIPLPWSANNEQLNQAKILDRAGAAYIFSQQEKPEKLFDLILDCQKRLTLMSKNYCQLDQYRRLIKKPHEFLNQLLS